MATLETQLIKAVQEENLDEVRALLENGANINMFTSGRTPLAIAAYLGSIPLLELLLNSGQFGASSDATENNDQSSSPKLRKSKHKKRKQANPSNNGYFVFIHNEDVEMGTGTKVPKPDESTSSLSKNNNVPSTEEVSTPEGMEKLEWDLEVEDEATWFDDEDVWSKQYKWYAKILANTRLSVEESSRQCDVNLQDSVGRCAIHYAAEYGHNNAVKILINAGCKVDIGDVDSLTPLHLAANRGHYNVCDTLLISGALVNAKTTDKLSPLHYAASRGFTDIVELLISRGANVDSLDSTDRSPLKLAVSRNLYDVAKALIKHGARVNIEDFKGYTAICEAVWQKSVEMVRLLLEAGARVTPTPYLLHYAILHRHEEMVQLLLKAGALVNNRDNHGNTPIITAGITGQTDIVKMLLEHGAQVDGPMGMCEKPPLGAVIAHHGPTFEGVVRALVEGGADINRPFCSQTPLLAAILGHKLKIAALLIKLGADPTRGLDIINTHNDAMALSRRIGSLTLVQLITYSGYDVYNKCEVRPRFGEPLDIETSEGWLFYQRMNPFSLSEICRIAIRSQAGERRMDAYIESLDLPSVLKGYLMFSDVVIRKPTITTPFSAMSFFPVEA